MSAAHTSKVRIYDLAKELKMESKRILEEVRREGVDVSVPSNTISKELAEKIRNKYFPKKEPTVHRAIRVVKKARPAEAEHVDAEPHAPEPEQAPVPEVYAEPAETSAPPAHEQPSDGAGGAVRPLTPRVKKLAPAAPRRRRRHTRGGSASAGAAGATSGAAEAARWTSLCTAPPARPPRRRPLTSRRPTRGDREAAAAAAAVGPCRRRATARVTSAA